MRIENIILAWHILWSIQQSIQNIFPADDFLLLSNGRMQGKYPWPFFSKLLPWWLEPTYHFKKGFILYVSNAWTMLCEYHLFVTEIAKVAGTFEKVNIRMGFRMRHMLEIED